MLIHLQRVIKLFTTPLFSFKRWMRVLFSRARPVRGKATFQVTPLSFALFSARFSALSGNSINLTTVKAGIRRSFPICRQIRPISVQPNRCIFYLPSGFYNTILS